MGYCINCDNRHGCKSGDPPCIGEMKKDGVAGVSGKRYLIETGRIDRCGDCPFFRSCWDAEQYERLVRSLPSKRLVRSLPSKRLVRSLPSVRRRPAGK